MTEIMLNINKFIDIIAGNPFYQIILLILLLGIIWTTIVNIGIMLLFSSIHVSKRCFIGRYDIFNEDDVFEMNQTGDAIQKLYCMAKCGELVCEIIGEERDIVNQFIYNYMTGRLDFNVLKLTDSQLISFKNELNNYTLITQKTA